MANSAHNRKGQYRQTLSSKLITYLFAGSMVAIGLKTINTRHGGFETLLKNWTAMAASEFSHWAGDVRLERELGRPESAFGANTKRLSLFGEDDGLPRPKTRFLGSGEEAKVPDPHTHLEKDDREELNSLINKL
jgi:hypothetical protein